MAGRRPGRLPEPSGRDTAPVGDLRAAVPRPAGRSRVLPGRDGGAGGAGADRVPRCRVRGGGEPPRAQRRSQRPRQWLEAAHALGAAHPAGAQRRSTRRARPRPYGLRRFLAAGRDGARRRAARHPADALPGGVRQADRYGAGDGSRRLHDHRPGGRSRVPATSRRRPGMAAAWRGPGARARRPRLVATQGRRARGGQHPAREPQGPCPLREPRFPPRAARPVGVERRRPTMILRQAGRAATVLALAAATLTMSGAVGTAVAGADTPAGGRLNLTQQTPWVSPGQSFQLRLSVSSALPRTRLGVAVTVFDKLTSRSALSQTLQGRSVGVLRAFAPTAVSALPAGPAGEVTVTIPVVSSPPQPPVPPGGASLDLGSCAGGCGGVD